MKTIKDCMKTIQEFKVGTHSIGYVDSDLFDRTPKEFESVALLGRNQTLTRYMTDSEIESEMKPGICTLGDVLALLESTDEKYRDGNWNIFYFPSCVVFVGWHSVRREWYVYAWLRDEDAWSAGFRVFSPQSDRSAVSLETRDMTLESSDTLPSELQINGFTYRRVDGDSAPLP